MEFHYVYYQTAFNINTNGNCIKSSAVAFARSECIAISSDRNNANNSLTMPVSSIFILNVTVVNYQPILLETTGEHFKGPSYR